jgi:hypothetical protein
VEGSPSVPFKGVWQALDAATKMQQPRVVTLVCGDPDAVGDAPADEIVGPLSAQQMADLYRRTDVVLKLSRVEGMYGPPLEAFHMGATVVTTPVTGHEEYVRHDENGLVVGWDDLHGTARALDLLARDRRLLHDLRCGALETARAWPDWSQSSRLMALALRRVLAEPAGAGAGIGARLTSDIVSSLADEQLAQRTIEVERAIQRDLFSQKAWRYALKARRQLDRVRALRQRGMRPLRWLGRRLRR